MIFKKVTWFNRTAATLIDIITLTLATASAVIVTASIPLLSDIWVGSTDHKIMIAKSFAPILFLFINGYSLAYSGQTIGKKMMGAKIISVNGNLPDNIQHFYRYIFLLTLIWLPIELTVSLIIVEILLIGFNDNKSLHDMLAKTQVVEQVD